MNLRFGTKELREGRRGCRHRAYVYGHTFVMKSNYHTLSCCKNLKFPRVRRSLKGRSSLGLGSPRRTQLISPMEFILLHWRGYRDIFLIPLNMRVGVDAEHEVAEGAVDVLAAALHGRLVGRVDDVDSHGAWN